MEFMSSQYLALLLIFGLGHHPTREAVDVARSVQLSSRIPCDGHTAPEDDVSVKVTFSSGEWARQFAVDRFQKESCELDVKGKCLHKQKEEWRGVWSAASVQPSANGMVSLGSCYAWGSSERPQYILSGWYKEGAAADTKIEWKQTSIKQVSSRPEVYELTDPHGGTARLEITRW
jgi:hypothetical protein